MKIKVYIGLFFLILFFLAGGLYTAGSISEVTEELEKIIILHKVEFLRENLLNKIIVVQADLLLKDTPHARKVDTFVAHVEEMDDAADNCLNCHHEEPVQRLIDHFEMKIDQYLKKLSRVYTLRANAVRLKKEKEGAFDLGQAVLDEVNTIVITSAQKTAQRVQQARDNINITRNLLYLFMIIGPIIIISSVYFYFRNFTSSVTTLTSATRKIKEGELAYQITDELKDEFGELASSFNEMAASLKEQRQKIRQTERLAAVGELAAGLAHEVKNPLAGIKVAIEVLKNELPLEQEDKEIFLRVINEINRIESLLKNLLNYARPMKPRPDFVSPHDILNNVIKNSEFTFRSTGNNSTKDINFVKDYDPDIQTICADPEQLQQIFLNLILNGIDAITEKGTITITTAKAPDGSVQISVSDNGRGIDPDKLAQVFNPFFTTKSKGNGLGLAICKRLIEQHNGTISVFNRQEGGVTFLITLPEKQKNDWCES